MNLKNYYIHVKQFPFLGTIHSKKGVQNENIIKYKNNRAYFDISHIVNLFDDIKVKHTDEIIKVYLY
jgi:hypothetical protein